MAAPLIIGGLLGAAGSIGGALLADQTPSSGDNTFITGDPLQNPLLAGLGFDAATGLGFADASALSSPVEDIANRIEGLGIKEKTKRRALAALPTVISAIRDNPDISIYDAIFNPTANNRAQIPGAGPYDFYNAFTNVLARVGLGDAEIRNLAQRQSQFLEQQQTIADSGLSGLQLDTIFERANMARQLQGLQSAATDYALTGVPSAFQQEFADRRTRAIDAAEEQAFLRAANTGQRPGTLERDFADLRAGNDLAALGDLIQTTNALQGLFSGQRAPAERTLGLSVPAQQNALNSAASQAQAANAILAQGRAAEGAALGSAVAQGVGGIGSAISNYGNLQLLGQLGAFGAPATGTQYQPDQSLYASNYQFNPNLPAFGYINTGGRP